MALIRTGLAFVLMFAGPSTAQLLDAAQIRPILDATQTSWVKIREWEGQDLLYFTHLLTWRCGLDEVSFAVNGSPDLVPFDLPACDEAAPNVIPDTTKIYRTYALKSIRTVTVQIRYDDGVQAEQSFARADIAIP